MSGPDYSLRRKPQGYKASAEALSLRSAVARLTIQVRDYEQELERHAADRVNQRAEVARLTGELAEARKLCKSQADELNQFLVSDPETTGGAMAWLESIIESLRAEAAKGGGK